MQTILLIKGKARSGKDTLASLIRKHIMDLSTLSVSINPNAREVKEYAKNFFNWDGNKDDRGRKLLIDITNTGYAYDPYFWDKKNVPLTSISLVPDWRYKSTHNLYRDSGKYRVLTLEVIRSQRINPNSVELQNDSSETELDDFQCHYEVFNDGGLASLDEMARQIALELIRECIECI